MHSPNVLLDISIDTRKTSSPQSMFPLYSRILAAKLLLTANNSHSPSGTQLVKKVIAILEPSAIVQQMPSLWCSQFSRKLVSIMFGLNGFQNWKNKLYKISPRSLQAIKRTNKVKLKVQNKFVIQRDTNI